MTVYGMRVANCANPSHPTNTSHTPDRKRQKNSACSLCSAVRCEKEPDSEVMAACTAAVEPAAPLAIPGHPPNTDVNSVSMKHAYSPMMGSAPAVSAKAIPSTTSRADSDTPNSISKRS